jgi:hypothetical protein
VTAGAAKTSLFTKSLMIGMFVSEVAVKVTGADVWMKAE